MPLPQVVASGNNEFTEWSTDTGARWVASKGPVDQSCLWYGDGFFWLGTNDFNSEGFYNLYKSENGIAWTPVEIGDKWFNSYAGMFANGIHVLVGDTQEDTPQDPKILTSTDGVEWTPRTTFSANATPRSGNAICFALGKFYASCYGASGEMEVVSSSDGLTWTSVLTGGTDHIFALAGTPTEIVAISETKVLRSTNGTTWTPITLPSVDAPGYMTVGYGSGTYVAMGTGIATSADGGLTWTARTDPTPTKWKLGVAYGTGGWIAVGAEGTVMTSTNGTSWLNRLNPCPSTTWLYDVAFSPVAPRDTFAYDVVFPSDGTTSELRRKVTVTLCSQANAILDEDPATPNHEARVRLAQNIITNPGAIADYVMWAIIGNPYILANGNDTSDADVNTAVSAIINVFAV